MEILVTNPQVPQTHPTIDPSRSAGNQNALEAAESAAKDFSIVVGGPVYDLMRRFHLVRQTLPNVWGRVFGLLAVIWLPLLLLSLRDGMAFGHQVKIPFLYDFAVYGRFFIGLPLLLYAELWIDPAIRQGVSEFVDARLVPEQELPGFKGVLQRVQHMRDSWIPEVILLVLAFFPTFLFHRDRPVARRMVVCGL